MRARQRCSPSESGGSPSNHRAGKHNQVGIGDAVISRRQACPSDDRCLLSLDAAVLSREPLGHQAMPSYGRCPRRLGKARWQRAGPCGKGSRADQEQASCPNSRQTDRELFVGIRIPRVAARPRKIIRAGRGIRPKKRRSINPSMISLPPHHVRPSRGAARDSAPQGDQVPRVLAEAGNQPPARCNAPRTRSKAVSRVFGARSAWPAVINAGRTLQRRSASIHPEHANIAASIADPSSATMSGFLKPSRPAVSSARSSGPAL